MCSRVIESDFINYILFWLVKESSWSQCSVVSDLKWETAGKKEPSQERTRDEYNTRSRVVFLPFFSPPSSLKAFLPAQSDELEKELRGVN